jgi:hypothetical protein
MDARTDQLVREAWKATVTFAVVVGGLVGTHLALTALSQPGTLESRANFGDAVLLTLLTVLAAARMSRRS